MALVIGVRIHINNQIFIGGTKVTVDKTVGYRQAQITVHGACLIEKKLINVDEMTTIMNQVKMGLAKDTNRKGLVRVLVDAPRSIDITVETDNDEDDDDDA